MVHMNGVLCSSGTLSQDLLPTCLDYCSEFTVVIPCVYICGVCMCMMRSMCDVCLCGCVCVWCV